MTDREMPWSNEAEVSVLGAILMDNEALPVAAERLKEGAFYKLQHRRIWRAMRALSDRGAAIDATTLTDQLRTAGELEAAGGVPYLAQLVDAVPTAANVEYHCQILREKATRRQLIRAGHQIADEAYSAKAGETEELVDRAEAKVREVARNGAGGRQEDGGAILRDVMDSFEAARENTDGLTGLTTGIPELDSLTGGLQDSEQVVVGGRPSTGKTALMCGIASHVALRERISVGIFSLEMSRRALMGRMVCAEAGVPYSRALRGQLTEDDYQHLADAWGRFKIAAPLVVDDRPSLSPLALQAKARRWQEEHGVGLIAVDYLQLLSVPGRDNRVQEVGEISRSLKAVAKELEIPVVALSQLSRAPEHRSTGRPRLADLRESGAIEQDADLVLFPYRPSLANPDDPDLEGKAELIIAKQRNGPRTSVMVRFDEQLIRFESPQGWTVQQGAA